MRKNKNRKPTCIVQMFDKHWVETCFQSFRKVHFVLKTYIWRNVVEDRKVPRVLIMQRYDFSVRIGGFCQKIL